MLRVNNGARLAPPSSCMSMIEGIIEDGDEGDWRTSLAQSYNLSEGKMMKKPLEMIPVTQ